MPSEVVRLFLVQCQANPAEGEVAISVCVSGACHAAKHDRLRPAGAAVRHKATGSLFRRDRRTAEWEFEKSESARSERPAGLPGAFGYAPNQFLCLPKSAPQMGRKKPAGLPERTAGHL